MADTRSALSASMSPVGARAIAAIRSCGSGLITWQSTPYQSGLVTTTYGQHVTATRGTFGSQLKFTSDGAYAQVAVDKAGKSGVIWERSSLGSVIQARFGA